MLVGWFGFSRFIFNYVMCGEGVGCVHTWAQVPQGPEVSDPLKPELPVVVSHQTWVLRTKVESSVRALRSLCLLVADAVNVSLVS